MHPWPRSTAGQVLKSKKCACHWLVSYFWKYSTVLHTSSTYVFGQYWSSFSTFSLFRKQGLLGLYSCCYSCWLFFARLQGIFFKLNWRTSACSCLHVCIVLMLVSIGSEKDTGKKKNKTPTIKYNPVSICNLFWFVSLKEFLELKTPWYFRQIMVSLLLNVIEFWGEERGKLFWNKPTSIA